MPLDQQQHGSNAASNDLISQFMREYRRQRRACDEANGVLRNIVKRAKAEGIDTKEMIASVQDTKREPEEVAESFATGIRYRAILGINTLTSEALFNWDENLSEQSVHEDDLLWAEERGYQAGRSGLRSEDCEYNPGSELAVHWLAHWHKGREAVARENPGMSMANPSTKRPKRSAEAEAPAPLQIEPPPVPQAPLFAEEPPRKAKRAPSKRRAAPKRKAAAASPAPLH